MTETLSENVAFKLLLIAKLLKIEWERSGRVKDQLNYTLHAECVKVNSMYSIHYGLNIRYYWFHLPTLIRRHNAHLLIVTECLDIKSVWINQKMTGKKNKCQQNNARLTLSNLYKAIAKA